MNDISLYDFIESELAWKLDDRSNINVRCVAENLADNLKSHGYCSEPYFEYEKALACPINKRHEKYCGGTNCESYKFCTILRKEGYV